VENFIPIIIFGVVILFKVLRRIFEYREGRPKTDEAGWDGADAADAGPQKDWNTTAGGPGPVAGMETVRQDVNYVPEAAGRQAPEPSKHVEAILEQLKRQIGGNVISSAPATVPESPLPTGETPRSTPVKRKKKYLSEETVETGAAAPTPPLPQSQKELVDQTMATAFPRAIKMVRETRRSVRRPIRLSARGRENLRHGILMAEVLSPPRVYDI
jgi:hypothetical protein